MGIRNLVVITGDPPKMGPFPHSTGVYDLDSIELLRLLSGLINESMLQEERWLDQLTFY